MDAIKEAFDKIKDDMLFLSQQLLDLKQEFLDFKQQFQASQADLQTLSGNIDVLYAGLVSMKANLEDLKQQNQLKTQQTEEIVRTQESTPAQNPTQPALNSSINTTPTDTPTHIPAHPTHPESLESHKTEVSTGNRGVPTDKPTNTPTHQQTDNSLVKPLEKDTFEQARAVLDSLDTIKKEIRLKFKRLTSQEMQVFSTLYALEEQNLEEITYKTLASRLNLSESSIRDYITRIFAKGIPILKIRKNNKTITLRVSPDLQNIASLSTIIKLREL